MTDSQSRLGLPNQKNEEREKELQERKCSEWGRSASATLATFFKQVSAGRRSADTCVRLRLISFLVDARKPDPADLQNDEKAECWGPEGMKGTGEDHGVVI